MKKPFTHDIVVIGGAGRVGLPLSLAFAAKKKKVLIYDINESATSLIRSGKMPFMEEGAQKLLPSVLKSGNLAIADDRSQISSARYVVVVVGTPVDEHLNPTLGKTLELIDDFFPYFVHDQVLILRSTIYPGITEKVHQYFKKKRKNVYVAFCPERIVEGKALQELTGLPQIVSSPTKEGFQMAKELFETLTPDIVETTPIEAELAKLYANAWRYIQFATANQFFRIADSYGLDYAAIHRAITHKYPRAKDLPMSGFAAGPCLFKDTMQLSAFANNNFFLGHAAMLANEGTPGYIVKRLRSELSLGGKTVGILGMAFKKNHDNKMESLSYKLRHLLEMEAKEVLCSDEFIKDKRFVSKEELVRRSDVIILGTPHSAYKNMKFGKKRVVDIWNHFGKGTKI